jgi:diguanylate cyclase (GGDEF)-like protein/PAS domain S-box-containing protein
VEHVEEIFPDARCSILGLNSHQQTLHTLSAPHLPDVFVEAMEGARIGEGVSASGTAAARREPVICEDILAHPYWADFRDAARNSGLRACWAYPILGRGESLLGTFAMYYPEPRTPHTAEQHQIADAAKLAAVVIESVHAEQALREAEERQRLLLNSSTEGIFGVDLDNRVSFINPAAAQMLGYPVEELQGRIIHPLIHHTDPKGRAIPLAKCRICSGQIAKNHHHSEEEILWRKDGSHFPVEYWSNPILQKGRMVGSVITFHDITERRAYEARIEHLAFHDSLTGLPNRTHLMERLTMASAHAARHAEPFAFHLLDLDWFKQVNDSYGHPVGDKLLIQVSRRILAILRADDTLARLGGDEFCLIQSAVPDSTQAIALAQRIIERLATPFEIEDHQVHIGVSIGITLVSNAQIPQEQIFQQVDDALYRAKGAGRNRAQLFKGGVGDGGGDVAPA